MNNLYLYFSGTGNTKYVIEKFSSLYEKTENFAVQSIEHKDFDYIKAIEKAEIIILGYPIHDSMLPFIFEEFIEKYKNSFKEKKIITIATQLLFSGDGGMLAIRRLRKENIEVLHTIHVNMPSNLTDVPIFPAKSFEESAEMVKMADKKIEEIVKNIKSGKKYKMGRRIFSWFIGFFTQRLWGLLVLKGFRKKLKIDQDKCVNCNKCIDICPMNNLFSKDNRIINRDVCTLCYRCVNACPTKAISLMLKRKPKVQYIRKDYN